MLTLLNVDVVYDDVVRVLRGVSLEVPDGDVVALLGANGAGKTTLLRAVTGLLDLHDGHMPDGSVQIDGETLNGLNAAQRVRRGIGQVPEGRRILAELSVEENLRAGGHTQPKKLSDNLERMFALFPILRDRRRATAGYLSGGEQQMLAIGRALMSDPRYLLLDEPSLGLAPQLVEQIRDLIVEINRQGTAILLIEQNASMALEISSHGYVLEHGQLVMDKASSELLHDDDIKEFYLGIGVDGARHSVRDVKHYRRRKRWLS